MIQAANVLHMIKRYVGIENDGREWLLEMMPKNSVCAEIGVFWGEFSRLILKVAEPKMLHLIDPWRYQPYPSLAQALYGGVSGSQERMDKIHEKCGSPSWAPEKCHVPPRTIAHSRQPVL